jgi:DDE domain
VSDFKGRHFRGEIVLWAVRWYCRYGISYRDLEQMMAERGVSVDHSTIYRWVQKYAPEIEKRLRWHWRRPRSGSWRVDETYVKVRGKWSYLYRAVDKLGNTIDFYLSPTRNTAAAKRFLTKALRGLKDWGGGQIAGAVIGCPESGVATAWHFATDRARRRLAISLHPAAGLGAGQPADRMALSLDAGGGAWPLGDAGQGNQPALDRARSGDDEGQLERQTLWPPS